MPVGQGPTRLADGSTGELLDDASKLATAAAAKEDDPALAALLGDRASTGQGLDRVGGGETVAVVTKLGEEGRSQDLAGTGQGVEEESVGVLGEELGQRGEGSGTMADVTEGQFGQDADRLAVGGDGNRVRLGSGLHEVGIASGDEVVAPVLVLATKGLKLSTGQSLGLLGGGVGHEELKVDLGLELAKEGEGLGVDARQEGAELVGLALDGAAESFDEANLSQDLLGKGGVGLEAAVAVEVSEEDAGQEGGVGDVGVGATGPVAIAVAGRGLGWDEIDKVAAVHQEIDDQVVGGLDSDQALAGCYPQLASLVVQPEKAFHGMFELDEADDGALCIADAEVMVVITPVNTEEEHRTPPYVGSCPSEYAVYRVPIRALEAQHAFDGAEPPSPGGRSKGSARGAGGTAVL
jgi:hypothetical protein